MSNKKELEFDYDSRLIKRKFTNEWANSGFININKLPEIVQSMCEQRNSMVAYIESLHDKIDKLILDNNICDCASCHIANCKSDHK
jgi:hypothetical protein